MILQIDFLQEHTTVKEFYLVRILEDFYSDDIKVK